MRRTSTRSTRRLFTPHRLDVAQHRAHDRLRVLPVLARQHRERRDVALLVALELVQAVLVVAQENSGVVASRRHGGCLVRLLSPPMRRARARV